MNFGLIDMENENNQVNFWLKAFIKKTIQEALQEPQEKSQDDILLSAKDAGLLFKSPISARTIRSWAAQNYFSEVRLGNKTFYRKSEILNCTTKLKKYSRTNNQS